jgi:O-antigen/teichoic acid export membrane protein
VSSLTNFVVVLYVARTVGAAQVGAFSLAYVTYSFVLNASRGLSSDPLMVRFSGVDAPTWRRAVASCTGTSIGVGVVAGVLAVAAGAVLSGQVGLAFLGLGLTLPGLMLQDGWRFSFFATGRGPQALLNDLVWALALVAALLFLRISGHESVFWFVFAWGGAGTVAAAIGPVQARVIPRLSGIHDWLSQQRDLGFRYMAENLSLSGSYQLRTYGVGLIAGLAAVGYLQAASTLTAPILVVLMGTGLVAIPEAARILRRSPQHLWSFCVLLGGGLAVVAVAWGAVLLVALPRGLGAWLIGPIWRPAYPLILPLTISLIGTCVSVGPSTGLHALGAAKRSLRAMVIAATLGVTASLAGAFTGGALGAVRGFAVATCLGAVVWWWQLRTALRESDDVPVRAGFWPLWPLWHNDEAWVSSSLTAQGLSGAAVLAPVDEVPGPSGRLPALPNPVRRPCDRPGWAPPLELAEQVQAPPGRLLIVYGRLLVPLLAGYLLLDKAFAYIHVPGTPLYVGELVLVIGGAGVIAATGYLRIPIRDNPVLALLAAYFLFGFIRFVPGVHTYGINAVRDFALVYYCLFALFTAAALARAPELLERMIVLLARFVPFLLIWLPFAVVLIARGVNGPHMPFAPVALLLHKPGDAAIAATLALAFLWLFPGARSARSRAVWSVVALGTIGLVATQNRGGFLASVAALAVGLAFVPGRLRLIMRAVAIAVVGLFLLTVLPVRLSAGSGANPGHRAFSASQLIANVASIGGAQEVGNLDGTVAGRKQLWTLVLQEQIAQGQLIRGQGFGINLALEVGVLDSGTSDLRSPHNSDLDVLARLGLIGTALWIGFWAAWYWRMMVGAWRLGRAGLPARRQMAVLCLVVVTATLVSSFFDPQLEGAQAAALMWVAVGIGIAVTSFRGWWGNRDLNLSFDRGKASRLIRALRPAPSPPDSYEGLQVPPTVNVPPLSRP